MVGLAQNERLGGNHSFILGTKRGDGCLDRSDVGLAACGNLHWRREGRAFGSDGCEEDSARTKRCLSRDRASEFRTVDPMVRHDAMYAVRISIFLQLEECFDLLLKRLLRGSGCGGRTPKGHAG